MTLLPLLLVIGCGTPPEAPSGPIVVPEHATVAALVRDAVAQGDLTAARAQGAALHATMSAVPASSDQAPHHARAVQAATALADAPNLKDAATRIGELSGACGDCHATGAVKVSGATPPAPEPGTDAAAEMRVHVWAAARLWDGIVVPDPTAFAEAAAVLGKAKLRSPTGATPPEVEDLEAEVHRITAEMAHVPDTTRRAAMYGELLGTCAECHALWRRVITTSGP